MNEYWERRISNKGNRRWQILRWQGSTYHLLSPIYQYKSMRAINLLGHWQKDRQDRNIHQIISSCYIVTAMRLSTRRKFTFITSPETYKWQADISTNHIAQPICHTEKQTAQVCQYIILGQPQFYFSAWIPSAHQEIMTITTKIEKNMNIKCEMTIELKIMQNEDNIRRIILQPHKFIFFLNGTQYREYTYNSKIANY